MADNKAKLLYAPPVDQSRYNGATLRYLRAMRGVGFRWFKNLKFMWE